MSMNKKLLRVLAQLEKGDGASLLCEVPSRFLKKVDVSDTGEVDLAGLLSLCQYLTVSDEESVHDEILAQAKRQQEEEDLDRSSFWYRMIYDRSLAAHQRSSVRH